MAIITAMTNVFQAVFTWIKTAMISVIEVFYTTGADGTGELTILGILALVGLGISIFFLLVNVISGFLNLRN